MKTNTTTIRPFLALLAATSLFGCSVKDDTISPATPEEVAQADVTIFRGSERIGRGVLVGYNKDGHDHVFFLTARHVVTYQNISECDLTFAFGNGFKWPVRTQIDRWITTAPQFDSAWYELNDAEKSELIDKNALRYIPLERTPSEPRGGMMPGTCIVKLHDFAAATPEAELPTLMFFSNGAIKGTMYLAEGGNAPIPSLHTKVLKTCTSFIFPVRAAQLSVPGDSGGPAFVDLTINGKTYPALAGLVIGANSILKINAIQPIDEIYCEIGNCSRRLVDEKGLW